MPEKIENKLLRYYSENKIKRHPVIEDVKDITSGWESQLFSYSLESGEPSKRVREALVLRLYSGDGAEVKAAREYRAMRRLYAAGYPVPRVYHLGHERTPFDRPFVIMDWIDGETLWGLLRGQLDANSHAVVASFCELFARLHQLAWHLFEGDKSSTRENNAFQYIDEWFGIAENALGHYQLFGFIPVLDWLRTRRERMACPRPSAVHLDFHPGNVLVRKNGSLVVIDWTNFQISDPRFDLAWTLLLAYSYLGPTAREILLREYERASGHEVKALACFEVFACLRRLFDMLVSVQFGAEKMGMLPAAVEEMRKDKVAYERVYAMLMQRTGIRVPEIETMLSSLTPKSA